MIYSSPNNLWSGKILVRTNNLKIKCQKIKVVLTDVDGVLTDGGLYYTSKGDIMKKFFVRDGMGVTLLRKQQIPTIIITKEKTLQVKKWSKSMKIEKLFDGIINKESLLEKICKDYSINPENVAYIGDDVNDINLLKKVGLSVAPNDGLPQVKKIVDYVTLSKGGRGVFRELAEMLLKYSKKND